MATLLLLLIIYLAFISLGLPDTIVGVTIPALQDEFGISLATGGLLSLLIIGGTVISSFLSHRIIHKVGTGKIVFLSSLLTGSALLGFAFSPSYVWLLLLALPLGFGGGTVDVALNNYVANHFKAHHMNWLHSFWGVGATIGPVIMSWNLKHNCWQGGFKTIGILQLSLALLLCCTLFLWDRHKDMQEEHKSTSQRNLFTIAGIPQTLTIMLLYCAVEIGTGLWGSSYLIAVRGFSVEKAAQCIALYYLGITAGRFLSGFISFKLNNTEIIRYGISLALVGTLLLLLPLPSIVVGIGVISIGLGLAPIFPAMIHEAPVRFGKEISQKVIGYQMGFAYIGSAVIPPLLGVLFQECSLVLFPFVSIVIIVLMLIITEFLNRLLHKSSHRAAE